MKISEKALGYPKSVIFSSIAIFIASIISYINLPLEAVPNIKIPYAFVSATYIGAAPSEIEGEIIKPLEEYLAQLQDVDEVVGYAMQNMGFFSVKFTPEADLEESIDNLKEKVNEALPDLSDKVENANIRELDFANQPISILNLYGKFSPNILRKEAERLQDQIEQIQGVNEVEMFGGLDQEITVKLDPDLLRSNNLNISQIVSKLNKSNINFPGGTVALQNQDMNIRTVGKFTHIEEIKNTIVSVDKMGNAMRIRDIGKIIYGFEEAKNYSRYNKMNSVTLLISKRVGYHIVETTETIETLVNEESMKFPDGLEFAYTARQATDIEKQNTQLKSNALWGILFVVLVLFAGIGFKNSLIVSLALPFSLMFSFPLMHIFELANTGIAMFGLIIVLGIVVDGAIIVAESTYRHLEEGFNRKDATTKAMREVGTPIFTSILTTMVAFAPIIYMTGTMGQFLSVIPKVVIFTLVGAFLADHFLIPVLASKLMTISSKKGLLSGDWVGKRIYTTLLKRSLNFRWTTLFITTLVLFSALTIIGISLSSDLKLVKIQMFPKVPKP